MSTGKQLQANRLNASVPPVAHPEGKGRRLAQRRPSPPPGTLLGPPQEDSRQFRLERFARIETGFLMDRSASLRYWDRREAGLGDRKEPYVDPASLPPDEHTYQRSIKPLRAPGSPQPAGAKRTQILPSANRAQTLRSTRHPRAKRTHFAAIRPAPALFYPSTGARFCDISPAVGDFTKWPLRTARTARFLASHPQWFRRDSPARARGKPRASVNCGQTATAL